MIVPRDQGDLYNIEYALLFHIMINIPIKGNYYTALLNAVERSVHLVNYFSMMTVAMHIMTAVKESCVFRINPCLTYQPQCTRLLSNVFG